MLFYKQTLNEYEKNDLYFKQSNLEMQVLKELYFLQLKTQLSLCQELKDIGYFIEFTSDTGIGYYYRISLRHIINSFTVIDTYFLEYLDTESFVSVKKEAERLSSRIQEKHKNLKSLLK